MVLSVVLGSSFLVLLLDSCFLIPSSFFFLRLLKAQKVAKIDHSVIFFGTGPRAEWVAQSSCFFELCGSWFGQAADFLKGDAAPRQILSTEAARGSLRYPSSDVAPVGANLE